MAQYDVKAPDGSILTFEGPDDATPEDILKAASTMHKAAEAKQKEENMAEANRQAAGGSIADTLGTFMSKAVNSVTLGIPEYLDRTLGGPAIENGMPTWQSPAQRAAVQQAAAERNPVAAAAGEIAGYGVPAYAGAKVIGGGLKYLGGRALGAIAPEATISAAAAANPMTALVGGHIIPGAAGGYMGAQLGVAAPDIIRGDLPGAVGSASIMNQAVKGVPYIGPTAGVIGSAVPLGISALDELRRKASRGQ
jgi:hypothetical protein